MATLVEKWIEKGVQQGRQEGEQAGRQAGRREGWLEGERAGERRGLLTGIEAGLQLRFGAEGLALMSQIAAIDDAERLSRIQAALFTAASVDEVRPLIG